MKIEQKHAKTITVCVSIDFSMWYAPNVTSNCDHRIYHLPQRMLTVTLSADAPGIVRSKWWQFLSCLFKFTSEWKSHSNFLLESSHYQFHFYFAIAKKSRHSIFFNSILWKFHYRLLWVAIFWNHIENRIIEKKMYIINSSFANWQRNGWQRNARQKQCAICAFCFCFCFCSTPCSICALKYGRTPNAEANKNANMKRRLFTTAKILIIIISLTLEFHTLFIYLLSWSAIRFIWNLKSMNVWNGYMRPSGEQVRSGRWSERLKDSDATVVVAALSAVAILMSIRWDNNLTYIFYNGELKDINLWWMGE